MYIDLGWLMLFLFIAGGLMGQEKATEVEEPDLGDGSDLLDEMDESFMD